jgi:hypothetical protein
MMRKIVLDALKTEELVNQFLDNDCCTVEEVNEFYPDSYIISEAKYRIGYVEEAIVEYSDQTDPECVAWKKAKRQLETFVNKWINKCEPHANDGLGYEELKELIEKGESK